MSRRIDNGTEITGQGKVARPVSIKIKKAMNIVMVIRHWVLTRIQVSPVFSFEAKPKSMLTFIQEWA